MATYLLSWNPKVYKWTHDFSKPYRGDWTTSSKGIVPGDRLFMIRLGKEPRGIIGAGQATSEVVERHVDCELEMCDPERPFPMSKLESGLLKKGYWHPRASGGSIPEDVARQLEREWAKFLGKPFRPTPTAEASAIEGILREIVTYSRSRSPKQREAALQESNWTCAACEVDFSQVLGGDGKRVLQVHHRKQLSSEHTPVITKPSDLAVVCANCHLMIHAKRDKPIPVETLRRRLKRWST